MNFINKIRAFCTDKVQKIIYIAISIFSTFFVTLLFFVPFCAYLKDSYANAKPLSPFTALSIINGKTPIEWDVNILAIVVLLLWLVLFSISVAFLLNNVLRFASPVQKFKKRTIVVLSVNTAITALYAIGGFVFNVINVAFGGLTESASNVWPLIIEIIICVLFALLLGVLHQEKEQTQPTQGQDTRSVKKKLLFKKIELFAYSTVVFGLSLACFLTRIVRVECPKMPSLNMELNGVDLLNNFSSMSSGGQIMAFVVLACILVVSSFYALSLVSFFSKSKSFFRINILSLIVSAVTCFLIGMYGKYYEIIQGFNLETVEAWLTAQGTIIPDGLFTNVNVYVMSDSIYFFLAAFIVSAVPIITRPYSKGVMLFERLEGNATDKTAPAEKPVPIDKVPSVSDAPPSEIETSGVQNADPCPAFTELDALSTQFDKFVEHKKTAFGFKNLTLPNLVEFIVQYARDSRLHLFYTTEDIATFIAGLGTTKLSILQGMSGTGKTSLPKIFSEALYSNCEIVEVESSWRDKNELLGYYNEFSKSYTPKKFTQALYKAYLNPQTITFIVLDEMNLSRIEYYFSDFLSLMENEPDKRAIKLVNVSLARKQEGEMVEYKGLERGHTLKVLPNVWFVGTANRDESTYEISDKVYDRAHTMNFNKRAKSVKHFNDELSPRFITVAEFNALLEKAKKSFNFSIDNYPIIAQVEKLLEPYNISFGNRIARQIESFVSIYCACFASPESVLADAVERILLSKVVAKLELKSVEDKAELATQFDELGLHRCSEFISKLNED